MEVEGESQGTPPIANLWLLKSANIENSAALADKLCNQLIFAPMQYSREDA
ncbi:hypothetical protein [Shewanella sp. 10N.286.52.E4]|uniref:hypothetical protein n=1 Tax=Shewanella sp. 10N.286.52.E4 TaxID=3229715 RepID=UPI0035515CCB